MYNRVNVTASQDQFLDVMLKYRCRILFTTRSRYENQISLEVGDLNPDTLLELVGKFFPEAERKQDEIKAIIDLLHGHTFAVELAARLLANGLLKPKELLTKLQKEKAALDTDNRCVLQRKRPSCGGLHPRYELKEAAAEVRSQIPGTVQAD